MPSPGSTTAYPGSPHANICTTCCFSTLSQFWHEGRQDGPRLETNRLPRDARTLLSHRSRDAEWLERTLVEAPLMNAHWGWFHVAEDEINHRGQIRWLRARLAGA